MPYGIPWGVEAFICSNCREESWRPWQYCPHCGYRQDPRKTFKPRAVRPAITEVADIKRVLEQLQGKTIRLWDYCVSHCELQLRVAHSSADALVRNPVNTLILCGATEFITLPTDSWKADLSLEQSEDHYRKIYRLSDKEADVLVVCRFICIYERLPAKLFV